MFKKIRIALLLFVLVLVAAGSWLQHRRLTDWDEPLWIVVYPIAGDQTETTRTHIERLDNASFAAIETFMLGQAKDYRKHLSRAVKVIVGPQLDAMPPEPPYNGSVLSVMAWSLRLRYWAWTHESDALLGDISLFVIYHDPERSPSVPHSLGIKEGGIGVVHAFAGRDMTASNNVVITHEMLHTLGATDKYDLRNDQPLFPDGYADPQRQPLHPQERAEIMAGRIPLAPGDAVIPRSLQQVVVGPATAAEIGW